MERTGFPAAYSNSAEQAEYHLFFTEPDNILTLRDNTVKPPVEVSINFCSGRNRHRQLFGGGLGQPLARAVNARKLQHSNHIICDATGGFGHDALVFASLGCQVVLLERSTIMFELIKDAIGRAQTDEVVAEIALRMSVYLADSTLLPDNWPLNKLPHTIYLDPMYPRKAGKSAAAKKEMQTLKRLLEPDRPGCDHNEQMLLKAALKSATDRVVVKRPKAADPIHGPVPVGEIKSANTRFDLYHPR